MAVLKVEVVLTIIRSLQVIYTLVDSSHPKVD